MMLQLRKCEATLLSLLVQRQGGLVAADLVKLSHGALVLTSVTSQARALERQGLLRAETEPSLLTGGPSHIRWCITDAGRAMAQPSKR